MSTFSKKPLANFENPVKYIKSVSDKAKSRIHGYRNKIIFDTNTDMFIGIGMIKLDAPGEQKEREIFVVQSSQKENVKKYLAVELYNYFEQESWLNESNCDKDFKNDILWIIQGGCDANHYKNTRLICTIFRENMF